MELILSIVIPAIIGIVMLIVIGVIFARLYKRAEKDRAYVRTGLGGQKVVLDGGAIILPVFQAIRWVNLQTLRLEVRRETKDALITKDRMRVDIGADFYVRVKPDAISIGLAAQTLGDRTNSPEMLRELVEAKFVDALRSVAATMAMTELQENRAEFVKAVQKAVATDLELNRLELEAASLTRLDQTKQEFFDANNAFDAEGLAALTKITEVAFQNKRHFRRLNERIFRMVDSRGKKAAPMAQDPPSKLPVPPFDSQRVGALVKEHREYKKLSQGDLAKAADVVKQAISNLERGTVVLTLTTLAPLGRC